MEIIFLSSSKKMKTKIEQFLDSVIHKRLHDIF